MTTLALDVQRARPRAALFAITVFASAALVFLVEPMVAKLVLPRLGGSPSVWNTSLAFFQAALLAGYGYAHALQRLRSLRAQALLHGAALLAAALVLPLRINELVGPPSSTHPTLWLLGVLTVSIGAPFAVLSATAPLVQAWHARTFGEGEGKEPYVLYAASNLGSLLALLAYPLIVEPSLTLHAQRLGWSGGYLAFILLMAGLALSVVRAGAGSGPVRKDAAAVPPIAWGERLTWVALAAIPSSLMLGVTTYITTDVASAPFLWVLPLALYLATFIIAFQARPAIPRDVTLLLQAAAVAVCAAVLPFTANAFAIQLPIHLAAFFLTALMCHQALVARRPDPARLTEFYFWMSLGGVVGGSFNAFVAPVIFDNVWEYPLVLVFSCLARPWGDWKIDRFSWAMLILGVAGAVATPILNTFVAPHVYARPIVGGFSQIDAFQLGVRVCLGASAIAAFLVRSRSLLFFAVIAVLSIGADAAADRSNTTQSWRSFFGVLRQSETQVPALGGPVRMLAHGTTLHGAQALDPRWRCNPLVYYATSTPIGQVFLAQQREKPALRIGAVGLGTGSVSAYVRPGDRLTFFEIDPLVIRVSNDPNHFSYTTRCAEGPVDYVLGDARLTLAHQAAHIFDILLIDAFSSDAVPTHLLTVQAVRGYLTHLKPDGVLILHLSNRNLDLNGPAQAVARAAGGVALIQHYRPKPGQDLGGWPSPEDAVIIARSPAGLARFAHDGRWRPTDPNTARPWTDDYTNLFGALLRRLKQKMNPNSEG
ncbi:MAG: putative spermine/spermidine synthase protein [Phenylobacterium sp.]|uniref:fused MFS/spermidine synthase n=1 Tax=Phenylobacterium sp. TaxID=1871053 RepID=UPI002614DE2C|nr:fused MFS/spermidine synthase [Phenylobacterium sp.]MDB5499891.1 putative spermine/spermidine synthase protein [Phenylobacterium sp.]